VEAGTLAVSGEGGASGDPRSGTHWAAAAAMTGVPPFPVSVLFGERYFNFLYRRNFNCLPQYRPCLVPILEILE